MKLLIRLCGFSVLILLINCENQKLLIEESSSNLENSVNEILKENSTFETKTLTILSAESSKNSKSKILLHRLENFKVRQASFENFQNNRSQTRFRFSIFIIETFDDFVKIYQKITHENFKLNKYFLIVLTGKKITKSKEIFDLLWKIQIFNVNIMFEDENGEILVETFLPFKSGNCNDTTPKIINKFKNGKFEKIENFFPENMKNLHKCTVKTLIWHSSPYTNFKLLPNGTFHRSGREIILINALAESLNFTIKFLHVGEEKNLPFNETYEVAFLKLYNNVNCDYRLVVDGKAMERF
jgi:hypothetical protein